MKIAFYIQDGLVQVVLTPQGKGEAAILDTLSEGPRQIEVHRGDFWECRGGYIRAGGGDRSTFLVLRHVAAESAG